MIKSYTIQFEGYEKYLDYPSLVLVPMSHKGVVSQLLT